MDNVILVLAYRNYIIVTKRRREVQNMPLLMNVNLKAKITQRIKTLEAEIDKLKNDLSIINEYERIVCEGGLEDKQLNIPLQSDKYADMNAPDATMDYFRTIGAHKELSANAVEKELKRLGLTTKSNIGSVLSYLAYKGLLDKIKTGVGREVKYKLKQAEAPANE